MDLPFDATRRRRIFLMRHAEAAYFDAETGRRAPDPRMVPLTAKGRGEAAAMAELLRDAAFDRALCSGLPRTRETAETVLGGRSLTLEIDERLEEIRGGSAGTRLAITPYELAYGMFHAHEPQARYAGGESFSDLLARVLPAFDEVLADPHWSQILLVLHGGVNRAILTHLLGLGLAGFGNFEQDSGCLNVIDIDVAREDGRIVRRILRAVNVTPEDPAKLTRRTLTLEGLVQKLIAAPRN